MSYNAYDVEGKQIRLGLYKPRRIETETINLLNANREQGYVMLRRMITSRFATTTDGDLVKISNGEILPPDEPYFLMRARDQLAIPMLYHFAELIKQQNYDSSYILEIHEQNLKTFTQFQLDHPERMKLPGITKGK